ncbi:MAG TPA: DoxX family protein [Anaerolineaceae bacterium]|nr:DoxX family protein [Anaerolineaceae bacterium]
MNILLWIVQGLLALFFVMTGALKLVRSKEQLSARMGWVEDVSQPVIRMIGFVEILGGLGLFLPSLTRILPWLTPLAAIGLVLVMVGAALTHYRRKEFSAVGMNSILLILSFLVAMGRFWITPL